MRVAHREQTRDCFTVFGEIVDGTDDLRFILGCRTERRCYFTDEKGTIAVGKEKVADRLNSLIQAHFLALDNSRSGTSARSNRMVSRSAKVVKRFSSNATAWTM